MAKADEKVCTYEPKRSAYTSQKSLHTRAKKVCTHEPKVQTTGVYPDFLSISLLGGGKLTNSTLLTTMVVLFQNTFREAPPSDVVILTCQTSSKRVRKPTPEHNIHLI